MSRKVRKTEVQHIGEYDRDRRGWFPMCRLWPEFIPKSYPRRQRATTNGGECRACIAVWRFFQ